MIDNDGLIISLPWIVIWFAFNKSNQITNACSINHDYIHAWLLNNCFLSLLIIWNAIRPIHVGIYSTLFWTYCNIANVTTIDRNLFWWSLMDPILWCPWPSMDLPGMSWKKMHFILKWSDLQFWGRSRFIKKILLWYQKSSYLNIYIIIRQIIYLKPLSANHTPQSP